MHHRLHVITGEAQLVSEKERSDERQLFKLGKGDGIFQQLPLRLQGVKLVDELLGVCQEVMINAFYFMKWQSCIDFSILLQLLKQD